MDEDPDTLNDSYFWINKEGWGICRARIIAARVTFRMRMVTASATGGAARKRWCPWRYRRDRSWHPTDTLARSGLRWLLEHATEDAH